MKTGWTFLITFAVIALAGVGWGFVEAGEHLTGGWLVGAVVCLTLYALGVVFGGWGLMQDGFTREHWREQLRLLCLLAIWPLYLAYDVCDEMRDRHDPPGRKR